jgi:DNA modification methylase/superfamily II DNA or RNA helicase
MLGLHEGECVMNDAMAKPTYDEFLGHKAYRVESLGFDVVDMHPMLFDFQTAIVKWAAKKGRAAVFADCGMGKSFMQVEWSRHIAARSSGRILILAPLAVAQQTVSEAERIGVSVHRVLTPSDDQIQITNYDRLHLFEDALRGGHYSGIVLDESSILKSLDGKTRTKLIELSKHTPFRLCCTATPAPNDVSELTNHAEFLGVMSRAEMLATFFVHDSDDLTWRLKGHAEQEFWRWMTQWSVFVRRPSDLGFSDDGWSLPNLTISDEIVQVEAMEVGGIVKRSAVRRATIKPRIEAVAKLIANSTEQHLVWCGLNDEGRLLAETLGADCVLVEGQDNEDKRVEREQLWRSGRVRTLITKPSIFGFGMNWQHCARVIFLGIGDSYEQYYQAIRRCWRFGQTRDVNVQIVVSSAEQVIADNVKRKEKEATEMAEAIVEALREEQKCAVRGEREDVYEETDVVADDWRLMLGDSCKRLKEVPDASVGFSVFSPPFASLYTYSSSRRDLGNSQSYEQFFHHFSYMIPEILRVTMPGRRCGVHCAQVSTTKATHGVIGWRDFRGDLIRAFVAAGWVYDGEICIDKNPQAQAIRTRSKSLMFVQKAKDSSWLRPAMADYILLFRHPGDNTVPIKTDVSNEEWILFAHPIWYGIKESDILKYRAAREEEDEKHICPLQLETIERCIRLWSNPGETVLSPFMGIGSEGYVARRFGRKFVGIELKRSYFDIAVNNLRQADVDGVRTPTIPNDLPEKRATL